MAGEQVARVWRLYLVGGALSFEDGPDGRRSDPRHPRHDRIPDRRLRAVADLVGRRGRSSCSRRRSSSPRSPASTASSTPPGGCCSSRSRSARSSARPVTATTLRRIVLGVLTIGWGLRLAQHIGRRTIGKPEDPRYAALLAKAKGNPDLYALRMVYLLQGALAYLISAPVQVGMFEPRSGRRARLGRRRGLGRRRRLRGDRRPPARGVPARPGQQGHDHADRVCGATRGTRTTSATPASGGGSSSSPPQHWPGVLTIPAPIIMTFLLTKGSGVRILDKHMSGRAGWAEYAAPHQRVLPAAAEADRELTDASRAAQA